MYQKSAFPYSVNVKRFATGAWTTVGKTDFAPSVNAGSNAMILFNDTPYVAFKDSATNGWGRVMKMVDTVWTNVGGTFSTSTAEHIQLGVSGGLVYVAYLDMSTNKVAVRRFEGGNWINPALTGVSANNVRMTVSPSGEVVVAYRDPTSTKVGLLRYSGTWTSQALSPSGYNDLYAVQVDSAGTAFVAVREATSGNPATVLKVAGGAWDVVAYPEATQVVPAIYVSDADLALKNGRPWFIFREYYSPSGATAIRFSP